MTCTFLPPLKATKGYLASPYGMRRGRTTGQPTYHAGMDFGIEYDQNVDSQPPVVMSCMAGVVERVVHDAPLTPAFRGYGNAVVIRVDDEWQGHSPLWIFCAHMSQAVVSQGDVVQPGQQIGYVGNTSNGKFPGMGWHLHFELRHARPSGGSPYPGPYRIYNMDPQPWMAAHGLTFGYRGRFIQDWARMCPQGRVS